MISANQIKAARAWIGWSRQTLAKEAGVSPATIRNLEAGNFSYRSSASVRTALERKGFKLHGIHGFEFCETKSRTFEGANCGDHFYTDILETMTSKGGEVAAIFSSYALMSKALGLSLTSQSTRIEQLTKLAKVRCLVSDDRQLEQLPTSIQFRLTTHNPVGPLSQLVYGDKTAVIIKNGNELTTFVMQSLETVTSSIKDFEKRWASAALIPPP